MIAEWDIECIKICEDLTVLFSDHKDMETIDAAEFVDNAERIFALILRARTVLED